MKTFFKTKIFNANLISDSEDLLSHVFSSMFLVKAVLELGCDSNSNFFLSLLLLTVLYSGKKRRYFTKYFVIFIHNLENYCS